MRIPPEVTEANTALAADPRFDRLSHARRTVSQDDSELVPDVLTFNYRGPQFFLRFKGSAATAERTDSVQTKLGTVDTGQPGWVDALATVLDPDVPEVIVINDQGEAVRSSKSNTPDTTKLSKYSAGTHHICGGSLDMPDVSGTHKALCCRACNLRLVIPKEVETWADLRVHIGGLSRKSIWSTA